ncbi:MAG: ISAzo13-like element transposase-related protein [Acidimicrobiales bacterium]
MSPSTSATTARRGTTRTGLKVRAQLAQSYSPTGITVSDKVLQAVPMTRHEFHGIVGLHDISDSPIVNYQIKAFPLHR